MSEDKVEGKGEGKVIKEEKEEVIEPPLSLFCVTLTRTVEDIHVVAEDAFEAEQWVEENANDFEYDMNIEIDSYEVKPEPPQRYDNTKTVNFAEEDYRDFLPEDEDSLHAVKKLFWDIAQKKKAKAEFEKKQGKLDLDPKK